MRISDWSSVVCSSDLLVQAGGAQDAGYLVLPGLRDDPVASWRAPVQQRAGRGGGGVHRAVAAGGMVGRVAGDETGLGTGRTVAAVQIGRGACRERVGQYVLIWGVAGS